MTGRIQPKRHTPDPAAGRIDKNTHAADRAQQIIKRDNHQKQTSRLLWLATYDAFQDGIFAAKVATAVISKSVMVERICRA